MALTTILGFNDKDISAPMLARCSCLFRDWLNGLFSLGIDLPGLSAPSLFGQAPYWHKETQHGQTDRAPEDLR